MNCFVGHAHALSYLTMPMKPTTPALPDEATATAAPAASLPLPKAEACDRAANKVAEESFELGMRNAAMELDALDADGSRTLDFDEFSRLVREREVGIHSQGDLMDRFNALDPEGTGHISVGVYILYAIRDALARSADRAFDLLKQWDADGNGEIDIDELRDVLKSYGFRARPEEIEELFAIFDVTRDGRISYKELLRFVQSPDQVVLATKRKALRRTKLGGKQFDEKKDIQAELHDGVERLTKAHEEATAGGGASRPGAVWVPPTASAKNKAFKERLIKAFEESGARVMDIFREVDTDNSCSIDLTEFQLCIRKILKGRGKGKAAQQQSSTAAQQSSRDTIYLIAALSLSATHR